MLAEALAIACFISPNTSPQTLLISGPAREVAAVQASFLAAPGVRLVDRAEGARLAFAQFAVGKEMTFGDFISLMNDASGRRLLFFQAQRIPACEPGIEDEILRHPSRSAVVLGDAAALSSVKAALPGAEFLPVTVEGRQGLGFAPGSVRPGVFRAFTERAAKGEFSGVDFVLVDRGSTPATPR